MSLSQDSNELASKFPRQEALRRLLGDQSELLEIILESTTEAVLVCDRHGQIIFANPSAKSLASQNPEGTTFDTLLSIWGTAYNLDHSLVPTAEWALPRALRGEIVSKREARVYRSDGSYYDILIGAAPLRDNQQNIIGAVATFEDITKRKQEEAQRLHFQARLLDAVEQAVIATDLEGTILYWNRFAEKLYGWPAAEALGRKIIDMITVETMQTEVEEGMTRLTRGESWSGEFIVRRRDGTCFPAAITGSPIFDEAGQLVGRIGLSTDISERKRVEAEKARLFDETKEQRERLRALTHQLAEAQETERKELARELHDQIGQSLTALNLNLSFIRAKLAETEPEATLVQARLDDSLVLLAEMAGRIRNRLADLRPPMLDDYGLMAAINWYGQQLGERTGFTFTVHGKEPVPRLAPPVENALFRITQEALTNIVKHAGATQVIVTVETTPQTVRLVIFDDGVGFEPTSPAELVGRQSWGLLTMTERAEAVGGHCVINSRFGRGTQVIVEVGR